MSDPAMTSPLALPPAALADYQDWLKTIKQRIHASRIAANNHIVGH